MLLPFVAPTREVVTVPPARPFAMLKLLKPSSCEGSSATSSRFEKSHGSDHVSVAKSGPAARTAPAAGDVMVTDDCALTGAPARNPSARHAASTAAVRTRTSVQSFIAIRPASADGARAVPVGATRVCGENHVGRAAGVRPGGNSYRF